MPTRHSLSFPKSRRLIRASEFKRVQEKGRAYHGELLILGVLASNEIQNFRAGFITTRRLGGAVVRNRVRRCLREIVRKQQHEIVDQKWVVTIARVNAARASYRQLEDEWLRLAKRAFILAS